MLNGRKSLVVIAASTLVATVVGAGTVLTSQTAQANPSISDVQHRVDVLYHQAEQASERYNQIHVELKQMRGDVSALKADQARQQKATEKARRLVADSVIRQYEGDSLSAVSQAVVSSNPGAFVAQLTTMSTFNSLQATQYSSYMRAARALNIRKDATAKQLAKVAALEKNAATDKATIDHKLAQAKTLLSKLKKAQRERLAAQQRQQQQQQQPQQQPRTEASRAAPSAPAADVPASGRAATAVSFAMAQIGKPYVYGAAGPSAYDCSGLTMAAWGAAGVGLSHSAAAQYNEGTHISPSQLQPGDLVFYYSPISHVGMYIGHGMIVNAENPSAGILVTGLYTMPFVGAVRPG